MRIDKNDIANIFITIGILFGVFLTVCLCIGLGVIIFTLIQGYLSGLH